jgi:squalene-hopene/tetraprenyl-beta-curcumene cyclase
VIRAFEGWIEIPSPHITPRLKRTLEWRANHGWVYLLLQPRKLPYYWSPLWFGNQERKDEENPIYGSAKVLFALHEEPDPSMKRKLRSAVGWICQNANQDGGWGGDRRSDGLAVRSSIEETSLAIEALVMATVSGSFIHDREQQSIRQTISYGLAWLITQVELDRHRQPAPIGFYFAKLWYYERLYPLIFAASALTKAAAAVADGRFFVNNDHSAKP